MTLIRNLRRAGRRLLTVREQALLGLRVRALKQAREAREPLTDPDTKAVVSMTTYGPRVATVHLAIEAIGAGDVRPGRIMLWLDDPGVFASLPEPLRQLQDRGLEIFLTENLGPHTKYLPALRHGVPQDWTFITADDDVFVPRTWLRVLVDLARNYPSEIVCYRAHEVSMESEQRFRPYNSWDRCWTADAALTHFPTGVSGSALPYRLRECLLREDAAFLACAPKADDVWIHAMAVRSGVPTRQVFRVPRAFALVPGSQRIGLYKDNVLGQHNDNQIDQTYGVRERQLLWSLTGGVTGARP